ncbi:hypothetical protein AAFF_G00047520 [Aldrovandia affinis]|uniref:Uncharacterized protein n=1 Tax=Aldrovandia affinis TaxID=143900 RepID=A0AAD7S1Q5_9TELE|nr:hypothetical protein AAFF_G00047520 [Aldrovandia affinis]
MGKSRVITAPGIRSVKVPPPPKESNSVLHTVRYATVGTTTGSVLQSAHSLRSSNKELLSTPLTKLKRRRDRANAAREQPS